MGIERMTATAPFQDIFFTARDGLRLHARRYGSADHGSTRPLLCLAGLTRNGRDFHDIALALANGQHPRTVYTLDTRGRGLSEHDPDWRNYVVPVEMQDVIDFTTMAGLYDCEFSARPAGADLDDPRCGATDHHRRGDPERYRPRHRARGARAHFGLRGARTATALVGGCRANDPGLEQAAFPVRARGPMGGHRAPALQRTRW